MAGGVTTYDAMMPYVTKELPAYKNDPVLVTAMREACHHDLYVLANSVAMNGVGENTTIKFVQPKLLVYSSLFLNLRFFRMNITSERMNPTTKENILEKYVKKLLTTNYR